MITLHDAWVVDGFAFLRDEQDHQNLWRVPPPPALVAAGKDSPHLSLSLFRYPMTGRDEGDESPVGHGLLYCALDLKPAGAEADRVEARLRTEVSAAAPVRSLRFGGGEVTLWLGDQRLASGTIPPGTRPVVPLCCLLSAELATVLASAASEGRSLLRVTIDAHLETRWVGPPVRFELDSRQCASYLSRGGAPLAPENVPDAVDMLVREGLVTVEATGDWSGPPARLANLYAHVAQFLLTVAGPADNGPWSAIPGVRMRGALAPRREASGRVQVTLEPGGPAGLAFFAGAPLPPVAGSISRFELESSRLASVQLLLVPSAEVASAQVDLQLPGGFEPHIVLEPDSRAAAYFIRPANGGWHYRYRATFLDAEGRTVDQHQGESNSSSLVLTPSARRAG